MIRALFEFFKTDTFARKRQAELKSSNLKFQYSCEIKKFATGGGPNIAESFLAILAHSVVLGTFGYMGTKINFLFQK
jgi:hypothetical protein